MDTQGTGLRTLRTLMAVFSIAVLIVAAACNSKGGDGTGTGAGEEQAEGGGGGGGGGGEAAVAFSLASGFGAVTQSGQAGGNVDASTHGDACAGYVGSNPDYAVTVTGTVNAVFTAVSDVDTTLVITGPGGPYCDDDSGGDMNPMVQGEFAAGTYNVYVGTYSEDEASSYTLTVTEVVQAPPTPTPPTTAPTPTEPAPTEQAPTEPAPAETGATQQAPP